MSAVTILDASGIPQSIEVPNTNGRRGAANSRPVTLSDEDFATLSTLSARQNATVWIDGTVTQDMRAYRDVEIEIVGTPSVPLAVQRSITSGGSYPTAKGYDAQQQGITSITAAGTYSFQGFGYFKFTGGTGAAVYIRGSN